MTLERRTRLASVSLRRRREASARAKVRADVIARDGRCMAVARGAPGRCWFSPDHPNLDVHEVVSRARGGDHLDPGNCVAVCRGHHGWIGSHPDEATALGLLASRHPGG
jgi:5-methylcytosine-specific restriction endonuclease McrA